MTKYSLSHCAQIRSVTIDRSHYAGIGETDLEPLRVGLVDLARWSHVRSVSLRCIKFNRPTFDALADYLRASLSLTDVEIDVLEFQSVWISDGQMSEEYWTEVRSRITAALVALPKLKTLRVIDLDLSSTNLRTLLERAGKTRILTEFHRNPSCSYEPQYKLLDKQLMHSDPADTSVFTLDDCCSRHADQRAHDAEKQMLAALQGSASSSKVPATKTSMLGDAWSSSTTTPVSSNWWARLQTVDENEARKMVGRALKAVRNCDVHTFMRAA
ncbi:uncharacterized protein LOC125943711 [Dermacentor silvarum]|uniref:uncharacterized protein LOC125943711 n=1 Tax=Dermacentor silvarum TaxID=543639 RepID=UPI002101350F|nr:uncharacterized protein LOC125943711 [Dermacentor silvarum]